MAEKTILVVEDEKILLDLYTTVLRRRNRGAAFAIEQALSAEEAGPLLQTRDFALVITDYHLPGEDGIALIRKGKENHPSTAFILISGYLSPEIQKAALKAGAFTCLKKPCSIDAILKTVEEALSAPNRPASPLPESEESLMKDRLKQVPESAFSIDHSLRVLDYNPRFHSEYAPLKDYAAEHCYELLYDTPLMCPHCPLREGRLSGRRHLEQKLRLGEEIIERIEPWPPDGDPPHGFMISLLPRFKEEGTTLPPEGGKKGQAKNFFMLALDSGGRVVFTDNHLPQLLRMKRADFLFRPLTDFLYSYFLHYLAKQEMDFIRFATLNLEGSVTIDFISEKDRVRHPFVCEFIRREANFPADWEMLVIGMDMEKRLELHRLIEFERESLHRLRHGQFDMVITIDKDFRIKTINNACLEKMKAKHRDLAGADFSAFLARPRDRQSFAQGIAQAQTMKDVYNLRLDLSYRDQGVGTLVNISAVRDSFNDEIGYVLVLRDIERQLKMEATLSHVERMQALGQLAAGTAHQINNYTNAIMSSADLLSVYVAESLGGKPESPGDKSAVTSEALGVLKIIQDGIQKLNALTRHLTAFARAQQAPVISAGDVNQAVKETLALVHSHLNSKSVQLETAFAENLPTVFFSPLHLEQAVLNIIMNAVDAVEAVGTNGGRIRVATYRLAEWVCIAIADNGPGIPAEIRGRLFEAFITTKPAGVGTGLGLNVARGVVESIKGAIEVESAPDQGTTMTIKIPVLAQEVVVKQ